MNYNSTDLKYFVEGLAALGIRMHDPNNILYKYTSVESAKLILNGGKLLYQNPGMFNDPFELHNGLLDIRKASEAAYWEGAYQKNTPTEIESLKSFVTDETFEEMDNRILNDAKKDKGILCLSKTMESTLMWSHYSDKHSGVCLGFKMPLTREDFPVVPFDVNYESRVVPRVFNIGYTAEDLISVIYWMCTKSKVWAYEQEVRLINMSSFGLLPFQKHELCEIYFGASTSKSNIDSINDIVKDKGYALSKVGRMVINKNHFNLEAKYY